MRRSTLEPMYAALDWYPAYAGNPFIQALGEPLDSNEWQSRLLLDPGVDRRARALTSVQRQHVVQSVSSCFFPRVKDLELGLQMDIMLRAGYLSRNPTAGDYQRFLNSVRENAIAVFVSSRVGELGSATYPCYLVFGPSGNGKTTALKRVAAAISSVYIEHSRYRGSPLILKQIPVVHLSCPSDGSPRGFALAFFQAIDAITQETKYFAQYCASKVRLSDLVGAMAQIIATFGVGLLVADEIHHLANYRRGGGADEARDFLVKLSNSLGVPMILAGTYRAIGFLEKRFQNARRACEQGSLEYGLAVNAQDEAWRQAFLPRLWKYQWTKKAFSLDDEVASRYFVLTQALASVDVLLFKLVQQRAARMGAESITLDDFAVVFSQKLRPLHKALNALSRRHTDPESLKEYEDLRPPDSVLAGMWAAKPSPIEAPKSAEPPAEANVSRKPGRASTRGKQRVGQEVAPARGVVDPNDLRGALVGEDRLAELRRKKSMTVDPSLRLPSDK